MKPKLNLEHFIVLELLKYKQFLERRKKVQIKDIAMRRLISLFVVEKRKRNEGTFMTVSQKGKPEVVEIKNGSYRGWVRYCEYYCRLKWGDIIATVDWWRTKKGKKGNILFIVGQEDKLWK
ncbi:MAG: hypothetical protein ABDH28_04300 [Brevinematia bacterium]